MHQDERSAVLEERAEMTTADINDLPDSAFAYIEPGGKKDADGKTVPRSLRHYPIHDAAHVRNALARAGAALQGDDEQAKGIAEKAMPAIKAAAKKFGIDTQANAAPPAGENRDDPTPEDYGIACGLQDAKMVLASVKAKQLADPDYQTDPDDAAVMDAIDKADQALDAAIIAQSKDCHDDPPARSATPRHPATPKRALRSLIEQPPAHHAEFHVRLDGDDTASAKFLGYASTTGVGYQVRDWLGEYRETMMPGAFAKTLREQADVPLLFNHDGVPLASTGSDTSRLSEDSVGLRNEADLDRRDALTNSICVQLQRGVLSKMSFSFRAIKDSWNDSYDDRSVSEAALYDTSIVTYPANDTTSAALSDAMRSALGREGVGLMWSVRSALPAYVQSRKLPEAGEDVLEQALRALTHADEQMCRRFGPQGRARTLMTAQAMLEVRQGRVLSAANEKLLRDALAALSAADKALTGVDAALDEGEKAISSVLGVGNPDGGPGDPDDSSSDGQDQGGQAAGNPINPQDGAGPRSLPPSVIAARHKLTVMRRAV